MDMILEDSHDLESVEIGDPMKQGIKISFWVSIKGLTHSVDGNVVVYQLNMIYIGLEGFYHKLFLPAVKPMQIAGV